MAEARPVGAPEIHVMPIIPETDSFTMPLGSDSASLMPDDCSTPVSLKNADPNVGHARRNSTGDVDIPYARVTILSRYLSSSPGSCHDYCKYGKKEDAETKTMSPRPRRITKMQHRGQVRQDLENPETPVVRKKNLPTSDIRQKPDVPVSGKRESFKKLGLSKHLSFPSKASDVIRVKPKLALSKPSSSSIKRKSGIKEDDTIQEERPGSSSSKKKGLKRTISLSAINSVKKALMRPLISLSNKRSSRRVSTINPERFKKLAGISCLQERNDHGEIVQPSVEDVPEKTLHVIDGPNSENEIHGSQLDSASAKKIYKHSQNRNQASDRKNFNPSKERVQVRQSSSEVPQESSKLEDKTENTKPEHKIARRKGGQTSAKHKDAPAKRASFRTGRVVELQSEIKTPRRLKFKRRTLSDIPVSKFDSLKELRSVSVNASGTNSTEIETAEKVVLKMNDMEEKKDVQHLLNNMIEETASKLAETRKSKVKALVGAFETVISLQDTKASPTVAAS